MKNTGIVRKIDVLGRIVIPMEIRRTMQISENDAVEIFVEGENIIMHKHEYRCIFCGSAEGTTNFSGKMVCKLCRRALARSGQI